MAGLSVFSLLYPILNLTLQYERLLASAIPFFTEEIQNGNLGLRLSAILMGVRGLGRIQRLVRGEVFSAPIILAHRSRPSDPVHKFHSSADAPYRDWEILAQDGIYLVVITSLWLFVVTNVKSLTIAILSWALFFVVDDWAIIADNKEIGREPEKKHSRRITFFNLLLVVLTSYALFSAYHRILAGVASALMVLFLIWKRLGAERSFWVWLGVLDR
jgi:hypothetical protein